MRLQRRNAFEGVLLSVPGHHDYRQKGRRLSGAYAYNRFHALFTIGVIILISEDETVYPQATAATGTVVPGSDRALLSASAVV